MLLAKLFVLTQKMKLHTLVKGIHLHTLEIMREGAVEAYKKAIEYGIFPDRDTYKKLGKTLQRLKRYEEALEAYNICTKQNMQETDLYEGIAEVLQVLERYEEALQLYDKALSFNPKKIISSGEIYIQKGKILHLSTNNDKSLDAFEKALSLLPEYAKSERAEAHREKELFCSFSPIGNFK